MNVRRQSCRVGMRSSLTPEGRRTTTYTGLPVVSGTPARKGGTTDSSSDLGPGAVKERHSYVGSRDRGDRSEFDPSANYHEDEVTRRHNNKKRKIQTELRV